MTGKNTNSEEIRRLTAVLKQMGITPHRLRGQNFLIDAAVIDKIMAVIALSAADTVLEIGAGTGALTARLAEHCGSLTALEIEPRLAARLHTLYALTPQVSVLEADALAFDYQRFAAGEPYRLYANVPYNITTPLLKRLLTQGGSWRSMALLLQREAAERIAYGRGRANGPLTLLCEYHATAEVCFTVPGHSFFPPPAVESALLLLSRRESPPVAGDINNIMRLAETGFAERRKLLLNALSALPDTGREYWRQAMAACGLAENCRAEQLNLADFARLSDWHKTNA